MGDAATPPHGSSPGVPVPPRVPRSTDRLDQADAGTAAAAGGAARVAAQVVALLITLISIPFVVRYLNASGFGRYATITALVTIVQGVSELGLASVGIREWVHRDPAGRRELLSDLLGLRLVTSLLAAALALAFGLAAGYDSQLLAGVAIALASVTLNAVTSALSIPLMAELRQGLVGIVELTRTTVQVATQLAFILVGAGLLSLLVAMVPASALGLLIVLIVVRGDLVAPSLHLRRIARLLRESVAFAAASAVSVVYLRSTMLIVPLFVGATATGEFAIGFRAVESLTVLPLMLTGALFPLLAHAALHDRRRLGVTYGLMWRSTTVMGALAAAAVVGAAPLGVLVLSGTHSVVAIDTLALLGGALGAIFLGSTGMWMLLAERSYAAVLRINLAAFAANIALTIAVIELLGVRYAGLGILACEIGIAAAADRAVRATLPADARPARAAHLIRVLVAVVAAAIVFVLVRDLGVLVPLAAVPGTALVVLVGTRSIPRELIDLTLASARALTAPVARRRTAGGSGGTA